MSSLRLLAGVAPLLFALPASVQAQRTDFMVTGSSVSVAATASDFAAGNVPVGFSGFIQTGLITYSVVPANAPNAQRITTVTLRCALPCPASGSKAMTHVQWQRSGTSTWTTLTTTDVAVETRSSTGSAGWSNSLVFRFLLNWTSDTAPATTSYTIVLTATVTAP